MSREYNPLTRHVLHIYVCYFVSMFPIQFGYHRDGQSTVSPMCICVYACTVYMYSIYFSCSKFHISPKSMLCFFCLHVHMYIITVYVKNVIHVSVCNIHV